MEESRKYYTKSLVNVGTIGHSADFRRPLELCILRATQGVDKGNKTMPSKIDPRAVQAAHLKPGDLILDPVWGKEGIRILDVFHLETDVPVPYVVFRCLFGWTAFPADAVFVRSRHSND